VLAPFGERVSLALALFDERRANGGSRPAL
jgi:hypothetical protein